MRITDLLTENQQLDEGPILNKIGSGIGKAAGTVAKGVGAVAGGIAGLGAAAKKGFQAGKAQVAGAGDTVDPNATQAPQAKQAPQTAAPAAKKPGFTAAFKKALPAGQAYAKARDDAEAAGTPLPKQGFAAKFNQALSAGTSQEPPAAPAGSGQATQPAQTTAKLPSQYAQVKASIDKLDVKGKKQVLQFLQKSVGNVPAAPVTKTATTPTPPATTPPATTPPATTPPPVPAAEPNYDEVTGKVTAAGKSKQAADAAAEAERMKNPKYAAASAKIDAMAPATPVVKTRTGGKVAGELSQTPNAVRKRAARVAAKPATMPAESVSESYVSIFRKV